MRASARSSEAIAAAAAADPKHGGDEKGGQRELPRNDTNVDPAMSSLAQATSCAVRFFSAPNAGNATRQGSMAWGATPIATAASSGTAKGPPISSPGSHLVLQQASEHAAVKAPQPVATHALHPWPQPPQPVLSQNHAHPKQSTLPHYSVVQSSLQPPLQAALVSQHHGSQAAMCQAGLMHQMLMGSLATLEQETSCGLAVRHVGLGCYDIEGQRVHLRWGPAPSSGGRPSCSGASSPRGDKNINMELFVCEDQGSGVGAGTVAEMPLPAYLRHCRDIKAAVSFRDSVPGAPAMSCIPQDMRLTFYGGSCEVAVAEEMASDGELDGHARRCASMRKACEEARIREEAALAFNAKRPLSHAPVATPLRCILLRP